MPINTVDSGTPSKPPRSTLPIFGGAPIQPPNTGMSQSDFDDMRAGNAIQIADLAKVQSNITAATNRSNAAQRRGLADQRRFGLERFGLQREGAGLDRRDAVEGAMNNALQRGIFNSGIRKRNVARANERSDLQVKGINLGEKELRSRIKNALAGLRAQNDANRMAQDAQNQADLNNLRIAQEEQEALEFSKGIWDDTPIPGTFRSRIE